MSTGIVYLRPSDVLFVRRKGPYHESSLDAWTALAAVINERGLQVDVTPCFGLLNDNPSVVGDEACRYDACVKVPGELDISMDEQLGRRVLPGGAYLRTRFTGTPQEMRETFKRLATVETAARSIKIDSRRPFLEIYPGREGATKLDAVRAELCVPIST